MSNAALQAYLDRDSDVLAYHLVPERRAILFWHSDLEDSWWQRGKSRDESNMQKLESCLQRVTGLQRIWRRHHTFQSIVEFRLSPAHFAPAAVALRMSYRPDPFYTMMFQRFLERSAAATDTSGSSIPKTI